MDAVDKPLDLEIWQDAQERELNAWSEVGISIKEEIESPPNKQCSILSGRH